MRFPAASGKFIRSCSKPVNHHTPALSEDWISSFVLCKARGLRCFEMWQRIQIPIKNGFNGFDSTEWFILYSIISTLLNQYYPVLRSNGFVTRLTQKLSTLDTSDHLTVHHDQRQATIRGYLTDVPRIVFGSSHEFGKSCNTCLHSISRTPFKILKKHVLEQRNFFVDIVNVSR